MLRLEKQLYLVSSEAACILLGDRLFLGYKWKLSGRNPHRYYEMMERSRRAQHNASVSSCQ